MDEFLAYLSESRQICHCFIEAHFLTVPVHPV